jgi:hypothetical protein
MRRSDDRIGARKKRAQDCCPLCNPALLGALKERAERRRNSALTTTVATAMAKMTGDEAFLAHMTEAVQIDNGQWHIFSSWGLWLYR